MLPLASSSGSFLIKPSVGLMVWTLLVFGLTMVLLARLAFPRISAQPYQLTFNEHGFYWLLLAR